MSRLTRNGPFALLTSVCVLALTCMSLALTGGSALAATKTMTTPIGQHGYNISLFAAGSKTYFNPDSVEIVGKYVFVAYTNNAVPDGSNHVPSTIVVYDRSGKLLHQFNVNGRCDGLRYNPYSKQLWATSNEDANPLLTVINLSTWARTQYTFPATLHGGGYDDLAFAHGKAFVAASNPTLNSAGINTAPALVSVVISKGKLVVKPVLYGNATATDIATGKAVTLNLTDPDSMTIDSKGDVVLVSQADAELIFLQNAGASKQAVSRLSVGTQVDDTIWIPATNGRMIIVDGKQNAIYTVTLDGGFTPGTIYTEAPSDSGVAGFVGTVDPQTGIIIPVIVGLTSPTGLGFIPA